MSRVGRPKEHDEQTRARLRAAAERLVAEGGPDALSVRTVADEAGTTTRAVYSLFGSKDGLVAALAQTAFEFLYDHIDELPETDDPAEDVVAIGTKVVRRLVRDHPALYRIAFQRIAGLQAEPGLVAARERAWVQLQGQVARLRDAGLLVDKPVADAARELNAMWEGLANAELRGDVLRIIPRGKEEGAWEAALTTVVRGLTTGDPRGKSGTSRKRQPTSTAIRAHTSRKRRQPKSPGDK
jgi:AcrR family transcriptional regulator